MKLQYSPTDIRKVNYYIDELITLDDLFLVSYYVTEDASSLLNPPKVDGWLSKSHVVLMYRNKIIDSKLEQLVLAKKHTANQKHTKRVFRVI